MREILFRGKRKDNGEWVCGDLTQEGYFEDCSIEYFVHYTDQDGLQRDYYKYDVVPETVGQYTGLTDRNGKKIFEGDIIRGFMDYGPAGLLERIVSVGWHDKYGYQWNYFDVDTIEVIGNIHDNPELLKGGADNG